MEILRDVADFLGQADGIPLHRRQGLHDAGDLRGTPQPALQTGDHDRQTGNPLADVIVQIAGNPAALGFLRRNQPAEQVGHLPVTGFERRLVLTHHRRHPAASGPLHQQAGDERGLEGYERQGDGDVPLVAIPERHFAKHDDRPFGHGRFADAPAPELPPIEQGEIRIDGGDRDAVGLLAGEDAQRHRRASLGDDLVGVEASPDNAVIHPRAVPGVDRRVRQWSDPVRAIGRAEAGAGAVFGKGQEVDDRVGWQVRNRLLQIDERQAREIGDRYSPRERCNCS